jgi:hypothetical protein
MHSRFSTVTVLVAAVVVSGVVSGCATIFNGTDQDVRFTSEPSGAKILIGGAKRGTTPATLSLIKPGLDDTQVTFVKEGYEERTITLQKKFATASIFNIFGPTLLGFGIDAFSGALFNYYPSEYTTELERETASATAAPSREASWYSLRELRRSDQGHLIVPGHHRAVSVLDTDTGTVYVFK